MTYLLTFGAGLLAGALLTAYFVLLIAIAHHQPKPPTTREDTRP